MCLCVGRGGCGVYSGTRTDFAPSTVELHLSGLIWTTSHPDIHKMRIIGFSLKIAYIGSLKWEKCSTNCRFSNIFIYVQIKH